MGRFARRAGWALLAAPLIFHYLEPAARLDAPGRVVLLHILHLLLAGGIAGLLFLSGRWALARAGLLPEDAWERVLLSTAAGFLLVSGALFLLAAAGALHYLAVWILAALVCAGALRRGGEDAPSGAGRGSPLLPRAPAAAAAWGLAALLGLLFLGSLLEALAPSPQSPDALAHNLAYARLFADAGGLRFTPESPLFYAFSGYWELLLAGAALFVRSEVSLLALVQLLHFILGLGGTSLGIVCLVRRIAPGDSRSRLALGLFGAALFAGMRLEVDHVRRFPLLAVAPKSDLVVAALQTAAALVLFTAAERGEEARRRPLALLAGLLLGAAYGVKIPGGIAAISLSAGFWLLPPGGLGVRERLRVTGWATAAIVVAILPLLLKNYAALGNPLYPLLASRIGGFDNPLYFLLGGGMEGAGKAAAGGGLVRLLSIFVPSAPYLLMLGLLIPGWADRRVYTLLASAGASILVTVAVFSADFPVRYALHISAFTAVCAACAAGGLLERMRSRRGTGRLLSSPRALPVAWALAVLLAVLPTHLDNRLKRGFRTAARASSLRGRALGMNAASRFQSGWPGRLPPGARPLTFYRPERLFALTGGWRPAVAIESPELARLFAGERRGEVLEARLAGLGFTHVYFESKGWVLPNFPFRPGGLVARLRGRAPLWKAHGFEIYAIGKGAR
ncbi:MAG: hypothetical protein V3V62_09830 [bacterium]